MFGKIEGGKMISKELLSEVLNVKVRQVVFDIKEIKERLRGNAIENEIAFYTTKWNYINIYELAHKCKEWAFKKGYGLSSDLKSVSFWVNDSSTKLGQTIKRLYANTEPEAIFKACEWIMEQIKGE